MVTEHESPTDSIPSPPSPAPVATASRCQGTGNFTISTDGFLCLQDSTFSPQLDRPAAVFDDFTPFMTMPQMHLVASQLARTTSDDLSSPEYRAVFNFATDLRAQELSNRLLA
jgi:hypothetical protein